MNLHVSALLQQSEYQKTFPLAVNSLQACLLKWFISQVEVFGAKIIKHNIVHFGVETHKIRILSKLSSPKPASNQAYKRFLVSPLYSVRRSCPLADTILFL